MSRCIVLVLLFSSWFSAAGNPAADDFEWDVSLLKEEVNKLDCIVDPVYNRVVESYLKRYLKYGRKHSAKLIGRTDIYFPIFEKYLQSFGLPEDLKYLPVVESALNPNGTSRVGAQGLWQFMPGTAPEFGMTITNDVDERMDTHLATRGALKYLKKSFTRFESWELALASYNAGPGRVNRAIKRARSTKFSRVKRYLPRETQNYVPAFIAATFLMKKYGEYGIEPQAPDLDLIMTETVIVTEEMSFELINRITGISVPLIKRLNPSYIKEHIPYKEGGAYLILPQRAAPAINDYQKMRSIGDHASFTTIDSWEYTNKTLLRCDNYNQCDILINRDISKDELAQQLNLSIHTLESWNLCLRGLDYIDQGTELLIYEVAWYKRFHEDMWNSMPVLRQKYIKPLSIKPELIDHAYSSKGKFVQGRFIIEQECTVKELFEVYPQWNQTFVLKRNKINLEDNLRIGQRLRIK